ncbi:MAG: hypothetical protein JWQ74_436 [Marmoricola sp.]|nr:hypothetical protein [Marmoricola sp.]
MAGLEVRYHLCDLVSGDVLLRNLPLSTSEPIRDTVGQVDSATFTLNTAHDNCPANWTELIAAGPRMIVPTVDGDVLGNAYWLDVRTRGTTATPTLNGKSLESLLDRAFVPDLDDNYDDAVIVALLLGSLVTNAGFQPIGVAASGTTHDYLYQRVEDRKVSNTVGEIRENTQNVEWRTFIRWRDNDLTGVKKYAEVGPSHSLGNLRPDAIMRLDLDDDGNPVGNIADYLATDSYQDGDGATRLVGTDEGTGENRLMTPNVDSALIARGWPIIEDRHVFKGLVDPTDDQLLALTQALRATREDGTTRWKLTGNENGPRPGRDFVSGDTVPFFIRPRPPQDPLGGYGYQRVLGWELDSASKRISLIAWEDDPNA